MYFYHCVLYILYACLKCLWNSYKICISFLYSLIPIHSCATVRTGIITVCHVITHLETMSSFYRGSEFFEKGGVIGTQSFITALSCSLARKLWKLLLNFDWLVSIWYCPSNVPIISISNFIIYFHCSVKETHYQSIFQPHHPPYSCNLEYHLLQLF